MRIALLVVTLLFATHSAHAATAYEALRVLGKQRGEGLLENITEVRGERGRPQPSVWKITVKDKAARGGAKEYSVQGSRLTGEQSSSLKTATAPMNISQLNLDSDGVHQIAEREAKKVNFPYDHANYHLRAGSRGGSPIWEVRLVDDQSGEIGTLTLAATTGSILSSEGLTNRRRVATVPPAPVSPRQPPTYRQPETPEYRQPETPVYRRQEPPEYVGQSPNRSISPGVQRVGDDLSRFVDRVGRHMSRRGRQVSDVFYNLFHSDKRDTAGPHGSEQQRSSPPPPRDDYDTDYVRPSRVRD